VSKQRERGFARGSNYLRVVARYVLAVVAAIFGLVFRSALSSLLGVQFPYITFFPAIAISAWYGGLWPGVLTTVVSAVLAMNYVMPLSYVLDLHRLADSVGAVLFLVSGTLMSILSDGLRQARGRAERSRIDAEKARQESESSRERVTKILESISDAFVSVDRDFRCTYVNQRAATLTRQSPSEVLAKTLWEVFPHLEHGTGYNAILRAARERVDLRYEEYYEPFGIWLEADCYPTGEGLAIFFRDTTERKKREELVREQESRLKEQGILLELAYNGIFTLQMDGTIEFWNQGSERMYGWSKEEAIGKRSHELLKTRHIEPLQRMLEKVLQQGYWEGELIHTRKDGSTLFVASRWTLYRDSESGPGRLLEINTDITDRKRAEDLLRESEERLKLAPEAALVGTWTQELRLGTLSWSPELEQIFGFQVGSFPGTEDAFYELLSPDDRDRVRQVIAGALDTRDIFEVEFRVVRTDGKARWIVMRGRAYEDPEGRPWRLAGIVMDITDHKRTEDQLRHTQKLESLGVLAGGVAHDFNNLLVGIMGNASLALDVLGNGSPARPMLENALRASERAAHLTRQMLAYSGKGRFHIEPIDVSELVRDMAPLVGTSIPRHVQLRLELQPDLPPVEGDAGQLQQVVMNLLINAAEAVPEEQNGTVLVTTGVQHADENYVRGQFIPGQLQPGNYVFLEVHDTGSGMDEETRTKIFDPFFTTKFTGRGLGLAATLGIVRGHKGAIKVYSVPGRGSTFKVLLPAMTAPALKTPEAELHEDLRGTGTVLVVDDEPVVLRTAQAALQQYGYQVITAENGQAAIDLFEKQPADITVVLLDLTMPVMSGEEAFRRLRSLRPDLPIVISSGYNEVEAVRRFAAKGVAGFIQKPYTAAQLAKRVQSAINGKFYTPESA
jgi:PAS domain S-box-containing protein